MVPATQLISTKHLTPTFARHHMTMAGWISELQLLWTSGKQICSAPKVTMVKAELSQCNWCSPTKAVAFNLVVAVANSTVELTIGVGAASSCPDPTGPVVVRDWEGAVSEGGKREATFSKDWRATFIKSSLPHFQYGEFIIMRNV